MGKRKEEKWKQRLKELKAYKKKHGDCLVPRNYKQNAKLGRWVNTQRREYKKWLNGVHSQLTQERIDHLNEIDFVWEVGRNYPRDNTVWTLHFNELVKYKKKHGDCLVPAKYQHNRKLGRWVETQRYEYKKWLKGVNAPITQERIDQLNEIDFVWEVGNGGRKDETLWKQHFYELVKYKKKHGDCLVSRYDKHNAKLGIWVSTQRSEYKKWLRGVDAPITQERIDQLNEIDFVWEVEKRDDTLWKQQFNELVKYKKKHGDFLVRTKYEHSAKLQRWVRTQRYEYKKWLEGVYSRISQERIDQLNKIDFVWEGGNVGRRDDALWKQHFNELVKYKKKHGDCLVPQKYEHNKKLGTWVGTQRSEYKKWLRGVDAPITQERIDQLNEIDFVWEVEKRDDTLWKQQFNELVKYKKKHGDCLVSTLDKQNAKLGRWVNSQRYEYKKWLNGVYAKITQDRIDQLNEIDFVWDARFERKSKESDRSNQEIAIPSVVRRNVVASNKSNQPRKRRMSSKDRPKKRQRRRLSQDIDRKLSPSERKERRRFILQALYNQRNPMQPDEVTSV